jgi:hypothetical protein
MATHSQTKWRSISTCFIRKVEVDLNMLHTLVLNMVGGEVDDADVVAVDECAL